MGWTRWGGHGLSTLGSTGQGLKSESRLGKCYLEGGAGFKKPQSRMQGYSKVGLEPVIPYGKFRLEGDILEQGWGRGYFRVGFGCGCGYLGQDLGGVF